MEEAFDQQWNNKHMLKVKCWVYTICLFTEFVNLQEIISEIATKPRLNKILPLY